ncbi:MAG: DUF4386 domain-containing protein [Chitinophagaceae bacterium]|nr:DUF4386 domain-containing protein [Chitinophagaceae bacterium]
MEQTIDSLKKTARLAGLLYLIGGIMAAYGMMYAPYQTTVQEDSFATAQKILNNEFLFRAKIVSNLTGAILFVILVFVLYRLFKNVNEHKAKLMVTFLILQVPITFLLETFKITALMLLKGEIMKSLDPAQAQDMAMLFIKTHHYGLIILEIFWGLWLIPFGQLVYKSGFIPRILGIFLIMGGIAYIIESFTTLLFPGYRAFVSQFAFVFYGLGELSIILWLLIKGVKNNIPTIDKQ